MTRRTYLRDVRGRFRRRALSASTRVSRYVDSGDYEVSLEHLHSDDRNPLYVCALHKGRGDTLEDALVAAVSDFERQHPSLPLVADITRPPYPR